MTTANKKTRALISAMRSDIPELLDAACEVIDNVLDEADHYTSYADALMEAFDASERTAYGLLRERRKW